MSKVHFGMNFNRSKVLFTLFKVFVFTIPLSSYLSVRLLFLILLFSLISGRPLNNLWKRAGDIFLFLFILIIGLLYSQDTIAGFKVLETNFSLLAIPLVLNRFTPVNKKTGDRIIQSFLLGVLVSSLICLLYAVYRYTNEPNIQFFFSDTFTQVIKSHPTYLAYYIIFSITIELYNLYHDIYKAKILLHYIVVFFLFVILILTGGQTAFRRERWE
jgi:O-antigen ligase